MDDRFYNCRIILQKKIIISKSFRESLARHANEQNPYEACAILLGNTDEKIWETVEIFLTENIEKSEINFTVSNEQDGNCVITSQAISLAACPPDNDNPCNATIASVNSDESCTVVNPGTLLEATDSGYPNGSCTTSADDDVWYQFTAVGDQQIIQIQNVVGGFNVDHAVYEGTDCNNLTQLY